MIYRGMCARCAHFSEDEEGEPFCEAFGGPPPEDILMGGVDHRVPFPGDNGITFEPGVPVDVKWLESFGQKRGVSMNDGLPRPPDQSDEPVRY